MSRRSPVRKLHDDIRLARFRIRAMGELLDRWDEYEAMVLVPQGTRRKRVAKPQLSRELVMELQAMLSGRLGELEEMWERRN